MIETKDLNTDADNIRLEHLPRYNGLILHYSRAAMRELMHLGFDLFDVVDILENGYEVKRRRKGIIEKCLDVGSKTYKAVVARDTNEVYGDVYLLIHFGRFTRK